MGETIRRSDEDNGAEGPRIQPLLKRKVLIGRDKYVANLLQQLEERSVVCTSPAMHSDRRCAGQQEMPKERARDAMVQDDSRHPRVGRIS